jgi:hypothetical protein
MSIHGTSFECGYEPEVVEDTAAPAVLIMRRVDVWQATAEFKDSIACGPRPHHLVYCHPIRR